jgi:hypothetical protein
VAAGDLITSDWQCELNGLLMGEGTPYGLVSLEGLDDLPEIRTADEARAGDHGSHRGNDLAGVRIVTVELDIVATTSTTFDVAVNALQAASVLQSAETTFAFQRRGKVKQQVGARPRRRRIPNDLAFQMGFGRATLQLDASDPRIYAQALSSAATGLPSAAGGLTFPATFPLTFGAVSSANTILAVNSGNFAARPLLVMTGPVDTPTVLHTTSGRYLTFAISLAAGDTLTVDLDARSVLLNGTASRRSALSADSSWWELTPGSNTVQYNAAATTASTLTMTWRSAWL